MRTRLLMMALSSGGFLGVGALAGCGITTAEYDARVADLRKANEHDVKQCDDAVKQEHANFIDAQAGLDELRARLRELQAQHKEMGLDTEQGRAAFKRVMQDGVREREAGMARASEKVLLTQRLREELEAGVVWLDERQEALRLVIPEEVLFSSTSSALGPPGKKVLDAVARELKGLPSHRLLVAAYVDAKAGAKLDKQAAELSLTTDRAKRVAEYLVKQGVEPSRVAEAGFGALDAIADNATEDGRARNRRIEVQLLEVIAPAGATSTGSAGSPGKSAGTTSSTPTPRATPSPAAPPPPSRITIPPAPVAPPSPAGDDPGL